MSFSKHDPRSHAGTAMVILVGGDERQARAVARMKTEGDLEGIEVLACHPCWARNWNKVAHEVRRRLPAADAVVITTDTPTLLGHEVRRLARGSGVPWHSVRARGQGALLAAIRDARQSAEGR